MLGRNLKQVEGYSVYDIMATLDSRGVSYHLPKKIPPKEAKVTLEAKLIMSQESRGLVRELFGNPSNLNTGHRGSSIDYDLYCVLYRLHEDMDTNGLRGSLHFDEHGRMRAATRIEYVEERGYEHLVEHARGSDSK